MIVLKFGGTSVGSAQRIRAVAHLVSSIAGRKIVILSAMSGTTDALVQLSQRIINAQWQEAEEAVAVLEARYQSVIEELFESPDLRKEVWQALAPIFAELQSQTHNEAFTQNNEKRILSRGEIISTTLMRFTLREYENINAVHLDALSFMRINHNGEPEPQHIQEHLTPLLAAENDLNALFLTEGYICINAFGEIDNLRRGGSDYTATLVGEAANAETIQIWTDIDGLHNNDPRVVNVTSPVRRLHFGEAAELAHFGAKILHPTCIEPARRANIPIRLLNTLDPQAPGTLISCETSRDMVKAVSAKDGISLLTLRRHPHVKSGSPLSDYVIAITQLIAKHNLCVDLLTTMGDSYLIAVEEAPEVAQFAEEAEEWGSVLYQKDMTIVAVVGDMGWDRMGFESRILDAINDIPIRMISYGSSNYSLVLVIGTVDKKRAMIALSDHLFANINLQSPEID